MKPECTALVVAAGSASRMQGIDKALASIGGQPMLRRTVLALAASGQIGQIVVVTRRDLLEKVRRLCADVEKLRAVTEGGSSRSASVRAGLALVESPLVAIHDGARPLVSRELIDRTLEAARRYGAAAPAIGLKDTVKQVQEGFVVQTPRRSSLLAVQTPQVFHTEQIRSALDRALAQGLELTDDCSALEAAGLPVYLCPGEEENLKVTTPLDLVIARQLCRGRKTP